LAASEVVNSIFLWQQILGFCSEINSSMINTALHFPVLVSSLTQTEKTDLITSIYPQSQREKCLG